MRLIIFSNVEYYHLQIDIPSTRGGSTKVSSYPILLNNSLWQIKKKRRYMIVIYLEKLMAERSPSALVVVESSSASKSYIHCNIVVFMVVCRHLGELASSLSSPLWAVC